MYLKVERVASFDLSLFRLQSEMSASLINAFFCVCVCVVFVAATAAAYFTFVYVR